METQNNNICEFEDKVIDYCEGMLEAEDAKKIEAHLEDCAVCSALCREHKELCEALSACNADVPAGLHGDIMRAVRREALRARFIKAAKRYAAPIAAALVLAVALPVMLKNGTDSTNSGSPLLYSVTDEAALDVAMAADGKGRLGEPTDKRETEEDACGAVTEPAPADIAEAPAAEACGDYEMYQHVVENGEVVTCYNCPVVRVDADTLKALARDYAELVVSSDNGGTLFETDKSLLKALKKAGCDISKLDKADFIRVNAK